MKFITPQRLLRPRAGAWLSLLAMLLIFAGPLIGQGTGQSSAASTEASDVCGLLPEAVATQPGAPTPDHHQALWEKCGYCSLLFQHPVLADSFAPIVATPPAVSSVQPSPWLAQLDLAPVFPGSRSRAPPRSAV